MTESPIQPKSLQRLTILLKTLLILSSMVGAVAVVSSASILHGLSRDLSEDEAVTLESNDQVVGILQATVLILTGMTFCLWTYRANANVRALGAKDLRFTPGWAVGSLFVPVVCFWKPYQAMIDLWRASHFPLTWKNVPIPRVLPAWWSLWIASNLTSYVSLRMSQGARELEELQAATRAELASACLDVTLGFVAFALVSRIGSAQGKLLVPAPDPGVAGT